MLPLLSEMYCIKSLKKLVCELAELGFGVADLKRRNGVTQLIFATRSGLPGARGAAAHEGDEGYKAAA